MIAARITLWAAALQVALASAAQDGDAGPHHHHHPGRRAGPYQRQYAVGFGTKKWPRWVKPPGLHGRHHKVWPPPPPISNSHCPVKKCRGINLKQARGSVDLMQTGSWLEYKTPSYPLPINTDAEIAGVHEVDEDTGMSVYNVDFKPGRFTCLSCDVGTCASCDIMCDLSQCIGEFYVQECWCQKDQAVRLGKPMWWFREYDANFLTAENVYQFFCDANCGGGICDSPGLQCKRREDACKPWWWCNLPPPKTQNLKPTDGWSDGYSYVSTMTLAQTSARTKHRSGSRIRATVRNGRAQQQLHVKLNEQLHRARRAAESEKARLAAKADAKQRGDELPRFEANDFGNLDFKPGRFVCENAALPPKIQDPDSRIWNDRGYIVFDRSACSGSLFVHQCFCWDNVLYLKRQDPLTSEFTCDDSCKWGACEGRTCGTGPPPPLPPAPPVPAVDAITIEQLRQGELHNADLTMDPS